MRWPRAGQALWMYLGYLMKRSSNGRLASANSRQSNTKSYPKIAKSQGSPGAAFGHAETTQSSVWVLPGLSRPLLQSDLGKWPQPNRLAPRVIYVNTSQYKSNWLPVDSKSTDIPIWAMCCQAGAWGMARRVLEFNGRGDPLAHRI